MKAFALLLLAALALASVSTGATPDAPRAAAEMVEAGPAEVPGSAEVHEAVVAVPALVQPHAPVDFADDASVPASWASASDVPPPEA